MMLLPLTNQAIPCTRGVAYDVPCQMVGAHLAVHRPRPSYPSMKSVGFKDQLEPSDALSVQTDCPRSLRRSLTPVLARAPVLLDDEPTSTSDTPSAVERQLDLPPTRTRIADL